MLFHKSVLAAVAFGAANALPTATLSSRASPATNNLALIAELKTDANAVEQFQQLLTNNGQPLKGSDLTAATIFDFAKGGSPTIGTNGGSISNVGTAYTFNF